MNRPLRAKLTVGPTVLLLAIAYLTVGPAAAEQTGRLDVAVSFNGKISPRQLPRRRLAPVSLELSGSVRPTNGAPPPRLQWIELAFGARGGLDTAGLSICPRARLRNATQRQALERCRVALVGRGEISAEVPLNPAEPILARAGVLAFNGNYDGRPAVWVLANSASPPVSFVLPFYLHRLATGSYGVLMRSPVRRALGRWPRLRSFEITLGRRYRAAGELRSYLNARCPLPPRLNELSVPLARATYHFAPRPTLTQPIHRFCQVRR
jgi:hypothetical protein